MSVVHTQTETILFEPTIPVVPPITVVSKYVSSPLTEHSSGAHISIKVRNDSPFYYYLVWMDYTVSGVGSFTFPVTRLDPGEEIFIYAEWVMPSFDVTVDMTIYAEVVHMSAPMIKTSPSLVHTQTETVALGVLPPFELDLPTVGGIALAVANAVLIGYYAVTQLQKP